MKLPLAGKALWMPVLALSIVLCGCPQPFQIRSNPPDADVYVNGRYEGKTPRTVIRGASAYRTISLRVEKEGYEDHASLLQANELNQPVFAIGLVSLLFFVVPGLVILGMAGFKFPEHHVVELKKKNSSGSAKPASQP